MHTETGYLRIRSSDEGENVVELLVSDPTGISSIYDGTIEKNDDDYLTIHFSSTNVTTTKSAKEVLQLERTLTVSKKENTLVYTLNMEAVGQHLLPHLAATLEKVEQPKMFLSLEEFLKWIFQIDVWLMLENQRNLNLVIFLVL